MTDYMEMKDLEFRNQVCQELGGDPDLFDAIYLYAVGHYSKNELADRLDYLLSLAKQRVIHNEDRSYGVGV